MALVLDGDNGIVGVLATNADGDVIIDTNTFFVDAPNNSVGIGTLTPTRKLHVNGSGRFDMSAGTVRISEQQSMVSVQGVNNAENAFADLKIDGSNVILNVQSGGNVGIGTETPRSKLQVVSGVSRLAGGSARFGKNDITGGLFLHSDASTASHYNWMITTQDTVNKGFEIIPSSAAGNTEFSNPALVIIADTGNVGIGTTAPSEKLHVDSNNNTRLRISTTNTGAVPEIQLYNASKEWKIGVETSTDSGGGAYSGAGPNYFHIRNATDNNPAMSFQTDGAAYFHRGTLLWNDRQDIGRVDQGNTGSYYIAYGIQKFSFTIPSDNVWYDVITNFRETSGYFWATVSDASSRRRKVYTYNRTSPAYGVSTFDLVHDHGGGWNTGDFNFQVVSDGSSSFRLQCQRSSYYSSSNISNGRITFLVF